MTLQCDTALKRWKNHTSQALIKGKAFSGRLVKNKQLYNCTETIFGKDSVPPNKGPHAG